MVMSIFHLHGDDPSYLIIIFFSILIHDPVLINVLTIVLSLILMIREY
jgi:hypothetical protein